VRPFDEPGVLPAEMAAGAHPGTLAPQDRSVKMRQGLSM
jgi:hypothetical protein